MKALSDLLAVILFFAVYSITKNIVWATAVAIVVGIAQAVLTFIKHKKLETMQWVSLILIVVFGGATVFFGDAEFIMWKPTLMFWIASLAIIISTLAKKYPIKALLGKEIQLPDSVWRKLAWVWSVFLIFMGVVNLIVFKTMSESAWVNYKMFGSTGLLIVFFIAQSIFLARYLSKENNNE